MAFMQMFFGLQTADALTEDSLWRVVRVEEEPYSVKVSSFFAKRDHRVQSVSIFLHVVLYRRPSKYCSALGEKSSECWGFRGIDDPSVVQTQI